MEKLSTKTARKLHVIAVADFLGLTVRQLAAYSNVSARAIGETGKPTRKVRLDTLDRLADAMCCLAEDFLSEPAPARLAAIRADFLEREAARARQQADEAKVAS